MSVINARGFEIGATVYSGEDTTNSAVIQSIAYGAIPSAADVITFTGATSFSAAVGVRLWSTSAVPTAEGQNFPYGSVEYANNSVIIERLGIIIPATLDALSDTPTLQNLLNNHVRNSLLVNSQKQILNGSGSNNEITGLLNISGINTYSWSAGTSGDTRLDALRRAKTTVSVDYFMPEVTLLSPTDFERIELTPGSDGHYVWSQIQGSDGMQRAWGTRVLETHSLATGTALIANLSLACIIGNREGVQVHLSTEHDDFFARDMVAIKANRRFGLGVMRPNAICKVTFDSAPS
jgi:HK97 family phage major capsid protein